MKCVRYWVGILCLVLVGALPGADLRLSVVSMDQAGSPRLRLTAAGASRVSIEVSTNLTQWTGLTTGVPTNGVLEFVHTAAPAFHTAFYRGRVVPEPIVIKLVPTLETNNLAVGLITPELGGQLALTNQAGVSFVFSVAPGNVIEPVAVTMRMVTNLSGLPARSAPAAVMFEPDGYAFAGAALLTIRFPAAIDPRKVSSFGFGAGGGGFFLTPDLADTREVRIPMVHFSGAGTALWQSSERAQAVQAAVTSARDQVAHRIASQLASAREAAGAGADANAGVAPLVAAEIQAYVDSVLRPQFEAARKDCGLAELLTREVLSAERELALLGVVNAGGGDLLGSGLFQDWECNCVQEAIRACEEGRITAQTFVSRWLGLQRQAALMGVGDLLAGCGLGSEGEMMAKLNSLPCTPDWFGWISYTGSGTTTTTVTDTGMTITKTSSLTFAVTAQVQRATLVQNVPALKMQVWRLDLEGPASATFRSDHNSVQPLSCGEWLVSNPNRQAGSARLNLSATLQFVNGQLKSMDISSSSPVSSVELTGGYTRKDTFTGCKGTPPRETNESGTGGSNYISPASLDGAKAVYRVKTPFEVAGTYTDTKTGLDSVKETFAWTFNFQRKQAGP